MSTSLPQGHGRRHSSPDKGSSGLAVRFTALTSRRSRETLLKALQRGGIGEADRRALDRAGTAGLRAYSEAFRQGSRAAFDECRQWVGPWGFQLDQVHLIRLELMGLRGRIPWRTCVLERARKKQTVRCPVIV
jgi:hypothetical protein